MKKRIKIQGMLIFFALISVILLMKFVFPNWKKEPSEELFDILGVFLLLFGFTLRIAARGYKEEISQGGNKLVIAGPYYLMRHPMYFGTLLIGTGIVSMLLKIWMLPFFLIIYCFIYIPQIKKEEKILLKRFGEDYIDYCRSSRQFFPDAHIFFDFNKYISLKFSWLKKELVSLIATLTAVFAIEIWQDIKLFGSRELFDEFGELMSMAAAFILVIVVFSYIRREREG